MKLLGQVERCNETTRNITIEMLHKHTRTHTRTAYLGVSEQNRGVETGVGVSDVQSTVVGHFLLQGTDVCWEKRSRIMFSFM